MEKFKIPSGLSSHPPKKVFSILILVGICLILVPIYGIWDRKNLNPHFDLIRWTGSQVLTDDSNRSHTVTSHDATDSVSTTVSKSVLSSLPDSSMSKSSHDQRSPWSSIAGKNSSSDRYPPPSRLVNIPDFRFLVNPEVCRPDDEVFMLIAVGSHPKNYMVREAIRRTWGNPNITGYPSKLIFMFGQFEYSLVQELLDEEIQKRGDIIQGSFIDSYHNVTTRDLMAMRWAWSFCPQAKFIVRADDDISLDVFVIKDILERKFADLDTRNESLLACFATFVNAEVFRVGNYGVSKKDHPADTYETYCSGWLYIVNQRAARLLDDFGLRVKPFWMNDAYITGTLSAAAKIPIRDLHIGFTFNYDDMLAMVNKNARLPVRFSIGYVGTDTQLMMKLHRKYKLEYSKRLHKS